MKTILVPTDFSSYANKAAMVAASMGSLTGARVILLHNVYTPVKWSALSIPEREKKYPETMDRAHAAESKLAKLLREPPFENVTADYQLTFGVTYEEIVGAAKASNADLILMGTHGSENSERFFIGSTIQKVLREATCPVLTVKKEGTFKRWKKLVFAADLSGNIEKPFEKIRKLALALGAIVHMVVINRPNDFMTTREGLKAMESFAKKYPDLKFEDTLYCHTDIVDGILEYSEDIGADWIAMVTRNRRSSPAYLIGNTETLAYRSEKPILSVNILPEPIR